MPSIIMLFCAKFQWNQTIGCWAMAKKRSCKNGFIENPMYDFL